ncbi:hypothetical protein BD289DRAFT_420281 [Coniella lustricola]|uniref:Secreted protein n=1 Tax=Coniella lustricola TaxID=2025994 RepID=A0A2T3AMZ5_9PEZI|nr:hypothetical protein BD289DRAFT_420281 [Coniella lustricola]
MTFILWCLSLSLRLSQPHQAPSRTFPSTQTTERHQQKDPAHVRHAAVISTLSLARIFFSSFLRFFTIPRIAPSHPMPSLSQHAGEMPCLYSLAQRLVATPFAAES